MTKTFAFIIHPLNLEQLRKFWPFARIMPPFLSAFLAKTAFPLKITQAQGVSSASGKTIQGSIIVCPLLPGQFLGPREPSIREKIIRAMQIAKNSGASMLGLGGYISGAINKDPELAVSLQMPFTTGSALSAWSVFEALYRAARARKIDFQRSTLAVIGASCPVGSLCARKFSEYVSKIILSDAPGDNLEALKNKIVDSRQIEVIIEGDVRKAAGEADLAIIVSCRPEERITAADFKPNAVVCDIALPCAARDTFVARRDVTWINGELIKTPDQKIIQAELAETMLLTLEERFVNYSLDEDTNIDKLEEIADIAARHGFEVWLPGI
jgi:fatty aldehyde-generating acyl-ACP reductase